MATPVSKEVLYACIAASPGRKFGVYEMADRFDMARDSARKRLVALHEEGKVKEVKIGARLFYYTDEVQQHIAQPRHPSPFRPMSVSYQQEMARQLQVIRERAL